MQTKIGFHDRLISSLLFIYSPKVQKKQHFYFLYKTIIKLYRNRNSYSSTVSSEPLICVGHMILYSLVLLTYEIVSHSFHIEYQIVLGIISLQTFGKTTSLP